MQIIPALSIKDGRAADFRPDLPEVIWLDLDPYQVIDLLGAHSIRRVHLVDIDAAQQQGKANTGLIGSLSNVCISDLEVGGGIHGVDHMKSLQYAGVDYFVLGSVVYENPALLAEISQLDHIRNEDIMIAVDLVDGQLSYHGYREAVPDQQVREVIQRASGLGFNRVLVTDLDTKNVEQGPDPGFFTGLVQDFPQISFTAAGHIHTFEDIDRLKESGVSEVVVGYEFYQDDDCLKRLVAYNDAEEKAA